MVTFSYECLKIYSHCWYGFCIIHYTKYNTCKHAHQNSKFIFAIFLIEWKKLLGRLNNQVINYTIILRINSSASFSLIISETNIFLGIYSRWNSIKIVTFYFRNWCNLTPANVHVCKGSMEKLVISFKDTY